MSRITTKAADKTPIDTPTAKNEVAVYGAPRLPYHEMVADEFAIDRGSWKVLTDAIFPSAKTVESVVMALAYCKSRNLDIMKRPVHIVPMWSSAKGAMVETVWPGIAELRTTATRTGRYAGIDAADFGPTLETTFKGRLKDGNGWKDVEKVIEHPEWCRITVYKIVSGHVCKFVGPKVKWLETFAEIGKSGVPNDMWESRAEGQLEKCAEAAGLRRAFPEELGNELTAEEMHGKQIEESIAMVEIPANGPQRDNGPPREIGAPAENPAPATEQPRQEIAAPERGQTSPPRQAPQQPPQAPQDERDPSQQDQDEFVPFQISGGGETFASWSEKYMAWLTKARSSPEIFGWIDVNRHPLDLMAQKSPQHYKKVKDHAEACLTALREASKPSAPPRNPISSGPESDFDDAGAPPEPKTAAPAKAAKVTKIKAAPAADPKQPEPFLAWITERLGKVADANDLAPVWDAEIAPMVDELDFPGDKIEAQNIYTQHEKRLGID